MLLRTFESEVRPLIDSNGFGLSGLLTASSIFTHTAVLLSRHLKVQTTAAQHSWVTTNGLRGGDGPELIIMGSQVRRRIVFLATEAQAPMRSAFYCYE